MKARVEERERFRVERYVERGAIESRCVYTDVGRVVRQLFGARREEREMRGIRHDMEFRALRHQRGQCGAVSGVAPSPPDSDAQSWIGACTSFSVSAVGNSSSGTART